MTMRQDTNTIRIALYGIIIVLVAITSVSWAFRKPTGILDTALSDNNDLIYFATDAPDDFIVYSPALHTTLRVIPASERMSDMVISPDGSVVWTATKSGYVDRIELPTGEDILTGGTTLHHRIAPVLSSIALSANGRFIAVGYGNSEDYNSRNIKILPADSVSLSDELADFSVSGDIQDIVANPVEDLFYIVNSHSDRVRIYNSDTFRLEPDIIELGNSPGTFVVRPDGLRAYGAMNARKAVAVVDLERNETTEYIALGYPPYAMAFSPDGMRLYVASRDSSDVAIIDTTTSEIMKQFRLPPRLEGLLEFNFAEIIGISSDEKYLYVLPKRPELVIYDISMVLDPAREEEEPVMVQSKILHATPFRMEVIRGQDIPGV